MKLPATWVEARLGDVLSRVETKVDPQTSQADSHFYVGLEHIESHTGRLLREVDDITEGSDILSIKTGFSAGDILYGKLRPNLNKVHLATQDGICSTDIWALRTSECLLPDFAIRYLRSPAIYVRAAQLAAGANLPRLSAAAFDRLPIPLPTLPEQQRIVDVLKQADVVERLVDEFDELLGRVKRQLYIEMIGDPFTNPLGHKKKPLGKLIKVKSGDFLPAKDMASGGVFKVYGGNGVNGLHDHYMFDERKVVIGRVGAYCGAVHYTDPKSWITDNALYISETFEYLNDRYLVTALQLANLNRYAGQAGQPLISASRIKSVEILVPNESLQNAYADAALALEKLVVAKEMAKRQLAELIVTLTQDALVGNLTALWRETHSDEISEAAKDRDALLRKNGTKVSLAGAAKVSFTARGDLTVRPARHWLLAELSEFQRQVLAAFTEYCQQSGQPLLVEDPEVFARFCDDAAVTERLQAFGQFHGNRIRRSLSQLASLGLIAKITLPKQDLENGELDYLKAFRPLRPEEFTRIADVQALRKSLSSGVAQKRYYYQVQLDYETSERAGAGGMFQVILVEDEDGKDFTHLVDQGMHYASLDELKKDIASALKVEMRQIDLEEV